MPTERFVAMFAERARGRPGDIAVHFHHDRISYESLFEMARRLRVQIEETPFLGNTLCVPAKKSPEAIALVIACLMTGRRILLPSPELNREVIDRLGRHASCSHVLSLESGTAVVTARRLLGVADAVPHREDGPRLLLTTSGSTGMPKVVPILEGAADRFLDWASARFELGSGANVLSYAPLNFDLSLLDIWATLASGGRVTLADPDRATDASYLTGLLEPDDITVIQAVPMFYRLVADAVQSPAGGASRSFGRTRHVIFTGDTMPAGLLRRLRGLFPQASLYNLYGCTETNDSLMYEIRPGEMPPDRPVPLGRPLPGVDALLVDANGDVVAGAGTGELLVSTPFQTSGYLDTWLNKGRFVPHPSGVEGRTYFRTGDVMTRLPDGDFVLNGRDDFHVKVRGVRTNMQEVEYVIGQHPGVREAVVVALRDELAGTHLHAAVNVESESGLNVLQLRRHCAATLPRTSIPSTFEIAEIPLPRTPTGKVDRRAIEKKQGAQYGHAGQGGDQDFHHLAVRSGGHGCSTR